MASVSEVALKYAAKGAKKAQRADKNVRESVKETGKAARKESGSVRRWMQRHKKAIAGIGAATAGVMAAVISASPTLSAQLAQVRLAFSLLAMTIGEDVAPTTEGLVGIAFDIQGAYEKIPEPVRTAISHLILFAGVIGMIAVAAAGLSSIISGTFVATALGGLIVGLKAGALAIVGFVSGLSALTIGLIVVIIAVVAFAAAYITNWRGTRDKTDEFVGDMVDTFRDLWRKAGDMKDRVVARISELAVKAGVALHNYASDARDRFDELVDDAKAWGSDMIDELVDGIMSRVGRARRAADRIRSAIEDKISFDVVSNDRDARRWGSDLIGEFERGARAKIPELQSSLQQSRGQSFGLSGSSSSSSSSTSGGDTEIVFERGAIQLQGTGNTDQDLERMIREILKRMDTSFSNRSGG